MNAYLSMTKSVGLKNNDLLEEVIKKGQLRQDFNKEVVNVYTACRDELEWKQWYHHRYYQRFKLSVRENSRHSESGSDWKEGVFTQECASSVITGQGQSSVLETHLTVHPVYGFPYFPGTMIKGAAAHYCHRVLGAQEERFRENGDYYTMLFGSKEQASVIQYEDAWPDPECAETGLCHDVLTPHHRNYQSLKTGGEKHSDAALADFAPRDDDSPDPVHFLAVKGRFTFKLTIDPEVREAEKWLPVAEKIVKAMLNREGLGGKSSSGYGLFEEVK
ncbi:type III-B CRISPR module RAMP protein Cmr6 [Cohnella faecalis]|uniref:Type III-B CRISPR module RAMP protein Cmr6 n=2 Tax=Cohnella faecalis TaxID=2315694 RepID=A0A398CZT8_9BACL|nr:type III-B CRISPR module RAMP protein Cmr6 [Cohnella faecalis]RIE05377.1 type III-B CRISPR module RAMP protein Cmr6 [Cohnella faecalis]